MEYIIVAYPTLRDVLVNGQIAGMTNDVLMIQRGRHVFSLGGPQDYRPRTVTKSVENTTPASPLIINDFLPGEPIPPD
jgi:hypothetical protein